MPCKSCAERRKMIKAAYNGEKSVYQAAREVATSLKTDTHSKVQRMLASRSKGGSK